MVKKVPCCSAMNRHVFAAGQLAIGDVAEIGRPSQLAKCQPCLLMHLVIGGVAGVEMEMNGDSSIKAADYQRPDQLFQIGAMSLCCSQT